MTPSEARVRGIGHLQIPVGDPEVSARFYGDVLGMDEFFPDPPRRTFLRAGGDVLVLERSPAPIGSPDFHFGFLVETPTEMEKMKARLALHRVAVEEEIRGPDGWSVRFRDPDGHRLELLHLPGDAGGARPAQP